MRLETLGHRGAAALLILAIFIQAAGNVCLSLGMKAVATALETEPGGWLTIGLNAAGRPIVVAGVVLLVAFFLLFAYLLSHLDLSIAMPIISFEVVLKVACAYWILNEAVSPQRWLGTILVATGVALVGSSMRKNRRPSQKRKVMS